MTAWRLHLYSRFVQNAVLFTCESDRMDCILNHRHDSAFDEADSLADNPYTLSKEMVDDLYDHCGVYDKLTVCDTRLHSNDAAMKKPETFDQFHTMFSTTIVLLRSSDLYKISAPRGLITSKIHYQAADTFTPVSYSSLLVAFVSAVSTYLIQNSDVG